MPHIPPNITRLEQRFPIRCGTKRLFLATIGSGPITAVTLNGKTWKEFDAQSVFLLFDKVPQHASIEIALGGAKLLGWQAPSSDSPLASVPPNDAAWRRLKKVNLVSNELPLRIGADSDGGSRFKGEISSVRVFNRALSGEEIATLARSGTGALLSDTSLVSEWSFEQSEAGVFVSKVGARLRAKIVGNAELVETPVGKALRLDGSGYVEVTRDAALDFTEACTLEAWICPQELPPAGSRIIDKSQVGTSNGYLLDTHPGNSLRLIAQAGVLTYDAKLAPGQWVHVAATVAPDGQLTLYLQGNSVAQRTGSPMADVASLLATGERVRRFHRLLAEQGVADSYIAAHARLALECLATAHTRLSLLDQGKLKPLVNPASEAAADQLYLDTVQKLAAGLSRTLAACAESSDPLEKLAAKFWMQTSTDSR